MSKRNAAAMVAGLMMAHFDGPFDDSSFYGDIIMGEGTLEDIKGAEFFDENKYDLRTDREFHVLVADSVREYLMASHRAEVERDEDAVEADPYPGDAS